MTISSAASAFFTMQGENFYIGNDPARGPWDADACHAGPVTGVIARALELLVTDKQLMRLSVEILRPVPIAGFSIEPSITKQGRMVTTASAMITDADGKLIATASSLHMVVQDLGELPTIQSSMSELSSAEPGEFPIKFTAHGLPSFSSGIEVLYPPEENNNAGPTSLWMRTLPLVEGESPTPFQRLCPLADCGNGISRNSELSDTSFINPDITIVMHRAPEGEWLATQAKSHWQPTGLGLSEATLFDQKGAVASALQTLLLRKMK